MILKDIPGHQFAIKLGNKNLETGSISGRTVGNIHLYFNNLDGLSSQLGDALTELFLLKKYVQRANPHTFNKYWYIKQITDSDFELQLKCLGGAGHEIKNNTEFHRAFLNFLPEQESLFY